MFGLNLRKPTRLPPLAERFFQLTTGVSSTYLVLVTPRTRSIVKKATRIEYSDDHVVLAKVGVGAEFAPIDMGSQEEQKLERKRSRNRVAATKCRKKKLEKISKLEERVKVLKSENTDLGQILKQVCSIF